MRHWLTVVLLTATFTATAGFAREKSEEERVEFAGPVKDVTYHVVLLMESDDHNRDPYDGPAGKGLAAAGYGRLVVAGSATAMVTIGQRSSVTGSSRYGQLSVSTSMLNTTEKSEVGIKIQLQMKNQFPVTIDTTARAPLGRWFLVGAADSRIGLPTQAADGKRAVAVMRVDDGVRLLD